MGRSATHPGHGADARSRIDNARTHYETRAERRPEQIWEGGHNEPETPPSHRVGARPRRLLPRAS